MKKIFKIVETGYTYHYRYRVLQRHTILFFIHFWTSPEYAPPHLFHTAEDAAKSVWIRYPDAVIHDNYSENKTQGK